MKSVIGRVRSRITAHFVDTVARAMPQGSRIRLGVEKFGSKRMQRSKGEPLGDIDVLVVDEIARRIYFLEVKDFEVARTPAELSNEVEKLVLGKSSAVAHHVERMKWVQDNIGDVMTALEIDATRTWDLVPRIVVSEMLVTMYLHDLEIEVRTLDELIEEVRLARIRPVQPESTSRSRRRVTKRK